ncbi:MAG TPA: response regulator [Longimicrobiaceae bacterium]|nr:response regulator [Longimicrobiaceae bacterium]
MIVMHPHRPRPVAPRRRLSSRSRPLVLLIDPDAASRDIESLLVRYYGYEVRSAPDTAEGLHLARGDEPGAIVCDLFDRGPGGESTVERLRGDPATAAVPILVVSSYVSAADEERAMAAGAVSFLPKPCRGDELRAALVGVLGEPPPRARAD